MNEELRIIIRAVSDEARANLAEVRNELERIETTGQESGASIDEAMKAIGKGAAIAVGAIMAVTTAMVALGKSSIEFQKQQAKLVAGFQAVGSSAKQATETYKNLFRFLGDTDRAVEAAQSLARITTNEKELAEWTNILQGVYSRMGDSLPIESLAEAANETIKVGVVTGTMADALNWVGVSEDAFNAKLAQTTSLEEREALVRSTLNNLYGNAAAIYERNNQALIRYHEAQAKLDIALADAVRYVTPLLTELINLGTVLIQVLKPAFETISAVIITFVQWIVAAIQYIGTFFGLFGEEGAKATETVVKNIEQIKVNSSSIGASGLTEDLNNANAEAAKLKKQLMGFDELNVVNSQTTSSGAGSTGGGGGSTGGSLGGGIEIPDIGSMDFEAPGMKDFQEKVDAVRERMKGILVLAGLIGAYFLAWKLTPVIKDLRTINTSFKDLKAKYGDKWAKVAGDAGDRMAALGDTLRYVGGQLLIIAGLLVLAKGYSDAWVNGIDWGNFATMIGGIAAVVGGLFLAFGATAAGIGLAIGGIALLVIGIKDFIENGYSLEGVITILVGAVAALVGILWAFNATLLANPITWIVVGIMAAVAAFVILWNECDAFRNFWIELWENVKKIFGAFVESMKPAIDAIGSVFKELWNLIKIIWDAILPLIKNKWEQIKVVWDIATVYFKVFWVQLETLFKSYLIIVVEYFKFCWEGIKAVWDVVVGYFAAIWNTIAGTFKVVGAVLTGNWEEAWEGIKGICDGWTKYFKTIWESIKKIFSATGTFFTNVFSKVGVVLKEGVSKAVSTAINSVLSTAVKIINGFISAINTAIGAINKIPGVDIKKLKKLEVPKMATGGIVTKSTLANIGERGREAVLPLENNTGWMDILAERIANRNSTPSRIVLMLDGKELGYATVNSINDITRQTGEIPLVFA